MREKGPPKQITPTFSLDYFHPPPPKKPTDGTKPFNVMPYLNYISPDIPSTMGYGGYQAPYMQQYTPPIINNSYTIQADGVTGEHQQISMIYEDVLPSRKFTPSYTTLGERIDDYHFIRSTIFNNSDGNDINLHGGGERSIMSHIKIDIGDINPYNAYKLSSNPYRGMPYGFLIYRSCYPIRHNEKSGRIDCAKNSTAVNIRLYKMLEGSFLANRLHSQPFFDYDEWREVAFYENIREKILKKKVSPNFINMYGYFISEKSMIDYDKINLDDKPKPEEPEYIIKPEGTSLNNGNRRRVLDDHDREILANPLAHRLDSYDVNLFADYGANPESFYEQKEIREVKDESPTQVHSITTAGGNRKIIEVNPKAYLGKSLVILTESPTYSICGWASRIYHSEGRINEMIGRGFHNERDWMNVLFQLMSALYVMQLNGIIIDKFDLAKNVFIKDLSFRGQSTDYWKYKVNGIDYYIPNLGYLVMIDSNFRDLEDNEQSKFVQKDKYYKLNGELYNEAISNSDKKERIFKMFRDTFSSNNFGKEFERYGGVPPPPEVKDILNKIMSESAKDIQKDIEPYISKYMRRYIHNRVGTYLKESEVSNGRKKVAGVFKKGDILINQDSNGVDRFVLLSKEAHNGQASIITKDKFDDKDYVEIIVPAHDLIHYTKTEPIQQNYKPNEENLTEEGLLETYIIS